MGLQRPVLLWWEPYIQELRPLDPYNSSNEMVGSGAGNDPQATRKTESNKIAIAASTDRRALAMFPYVPCAIVTSQPRMPGDVHSYRDPGHTWLTEPQEACQAHIYLFRIYLPARPDFAHLLHTPLERESMPGLLLVRPVPGPGDVAPLPRLRLLVDVAS